MYFLSKSMFLASVVMLAFSVQLSFAQSITGTVASAETNQPLEGANVVQVGGQNGTSTRANGTFSLELTDDGRRAIEVSYVGYKSFIKEIGTATSGLMILLQPAVGAELPGIVVSATRAGTDDPITQNTISQQQIEEFYMGQSPSAVLQRLSPSIVSYSDAGANVGNYVQFRLRGMDQSRINTTLNGVPLNDMVDQGVFFSNFPDFTNSVESIQVQRGVGTSGNGTASYAGSINFESENLTEDPQLGVQLTGGSFDTYRASGEVQSGKIKEDLAFYSRFTRTLSEGYKNHSGSDSYSFFFSGGYLGQKNTFKVNAFAGKSQRDQAYLPVLRSVIEDDPQTNNNSPNSTDDFEQELVQLQYIRSMRDNLTLNSSLYYGGARGVFPFGLSPTDQLLFGLENNHYGFISNLNYRQAGLNLKAGVHGYIFRRENINSTAPNTSTPTYQDETDKDEISFFGKANIRVGQFNLFADVQFRYVNLTFRMDEQIMFNGSTVNGVSSSRDWLFINPKAGVTYNFNRRSSAYISFGRTGREPTRTDILQGSGSAITGANLQSVRNENIVEEEFVNDLEVGYRYRGSRSSFSANYFYMDFENEISQVGALAQNSYVAIRQNVPESYRSGVEFVGEAQITDEFKASLNASYLTTNVSRFENASSEVFEDVEHIFVPEWIIRPGLRFEPTNIFGFGVSGRYVSESFIELSNNPDFVLPEHFILDAQFDVNFTSSVQLSLMVNNIFDELYFNEGVPVDSNFDGVVDGPGYRVQPPRNFYGQLKFNF